MERKLATVMFVDLVGSTHLVGATDPEVVRRRVSRFFDRVSHCIELHGGTVEKFAGDAVMAAFGVPHAHEDDAERAARAALGIKAAVLELELEVRIGLEAGEVVTEDAASTFVTGEAVNIAARLQQAAQPGEILVGPLAHRLADGVFRAEDVGLLELRGLQGAIHAHRILCTKEETASARGLRVTAPFVGRDEELELLANTWSRAVRDRRAHLFTVFGQPGVGKSRLVREFLAGVEGATILAGRCLPYGEGITYWPLAEMVKSAAGISDDDPTAMAVEKLREACADDAVADLLGLASGVLDAVTGDRSAQEIAWAAQEWAAQLAEAQPLVLAFEDIHWAEEPLLDLIAHLAGRVQGVPLLIICLARPELLDLRPSWAGGRLRSTAIELEPLAADESEQLLDALLADGELPRAQRATVLGKAEGNPLFVEETVRMLVERGAGGADAIPDTVQALIAARIDRLPAGAREMLRRGAVIGRVFWSGALAVLSPEHEDVAAAIDELVGRELVTRESRSTITGEQAFRFKHVLIRDVAYAGVSKGARAELHRGFAHWLRTRGVDELEEIRAYHLDQAVRLLAELDGTAPTELAAETAEALTAAGRRALAREANRAGRKLLLRAVELGPTLERRYEAARAARQLTDMPAVSAEMETVRAAAADAGDARLEGRALTALAEVALERDADVEVARELAEQALETLPEDDDVARYEALGMLSQIGWWIGDAALIERHAEETLELARSMGRKDLEATALMDLGSVMQERLAPEEQWEPLFARALELAEESGSFVARAWIARLRGQLHFRRDELDDAHEQFELAHKLFSEAGVATSTARTLNWLAMVQWRRGNLGEAERLLRDAVRMLTPLGDRGTLVESQRTLAQVLLELGRIDEAERFALESRSTVGAQDVSSRSTTRLALGLVRAAQGRDREAETLFREALEIVGESELCKHELEPLRTIVSFLRSRGRDAEAMSFEERLGQLAPLASSARIS